MTNFKQKRTVGVAGGFINQLKGNNSSIPELGKGATRLLYSDRHAYQVIWVSEDKTRCTIQRCNSKRIDKLGMTDSGQTYDYSELTDEKHDLVWRKKQGGCWCIHNKVVRVIPKVQKQLDAQSDHYFLKRQIEEVYGHKIANQVFTKDEVGYSIMNLVKGITKEYDTYNKISIIFGEQDEYYDFSF